MLTVRRYVNDGDKIPRGYGVAIYEPDVQRSICYPLGLNVAIGAVRQLLRTMRFLPAGWGPEVVRIDLTEQQRRAEYSRGHIAGVQHGRQIGYREGWHGALAHMTEQLDTRQELRRAIEEPT